MDKLTLENLIFAHAARLESPVWARRGRLYAPEKKPLLRALIRVYNRFFARENARFLRGDVGENRRTRFWGGTWSETPPALCERLPRLYLRREVEKFYKTCRTARVSAYKACRTARVSAYKACRTARVPVYKTCRTARVPAYKTCRAARVPAKNKFDKTKFI